MASTIFLVLAMAMTSVCFAALDLGAVSREQSEISYVNRQLKRTFEKDFRHLIVGNSQIISPLLGQSNPFADTRQDQLSFTTHSHIIKDDEPWSNFQRVEYYPELIEEKLVLVRSAQKNLLQSIETELEGKILLENLISFKVIYDLEGYEVEDYDSDIEDELPSLIKLEIIWMFQEEEQELKFTFPMTYRDHHTLSIAYSEVVK